MNEQLENVFLYWWHDVNAWNGDNPYEDGTPQWWAWEGFMVGVKAERKIAINDAIQERISPLLDEIIDKIENFVDTQIDTQIET